MTARLRNMRRVLVVQSQMTRLAEWQLGAIETRKRDIEGLGRDIDGFIEGGDLSGDLAVMALRSRRRLALGEAAVEDQRVLQAEATRAARSGEKLAARLVEDLVLEDRRAAERRELEAILESVANRAEPGAE